jgi:DNA-directed RNA polymerase specialized sigma subunit
MGKAEFKEFVESIFKLYRSDSIKARDKVKFQGKNFTIEKLLGHKAILPKQQKRVFELLLEKGLTQKQVANKMGINQSNTVSYLNLAIEKIYENLKLGD